MIIMDDITDFLEDLMYQCKLAEEDCGIRIVQVTKDDVLYERGNNFYTYRKGKHHYNGRVDD